MTENFEKKLESIDFENDVSINKFRLDEECITQPALYLRYGELAMEAKTEVSNADDKLKLIIAEKNLAIRQRYINNAVKYTEGVIESEVNRDPEVLEARKALRESQETLARLQVAVSAMETKRAELDNLVKLYVAGYFAAGETAEKVVKNEIRKSLNK